ncbi:MAG: LamG domain-containing protein [Syntrophomonadaceae bacterium]|nr:LamG domain-containing protein [Syntrophomonadaceae bacterium]
MEVTVPEPEPDIARGMVLYLNFDDNNDGDLQVSDLSGNDNHGSIMDVDKVSFVDNGGLGKAIKFGGIDNPTQITVPNAPSLNFTDALTVSYWVKIDNTKGIDGNFNYKDKGNQKVFYKGDSFHNLIYTEMENNLLLLRSGSSDYILINDASFGSVINQWSHVTFVIAGNTVQAYLNGDKAGEVELLNIDFSDANANDLYIGRGDDCLWYPLYGTIDEFRIYNRALTSAEVELLSQFAAPEL